MTIAQQLGIKDFPFEIKDSQGRQIYWEDFDRDWAKRVYDANGKQIRYENSTGFWAKWEYDTQGNEIYYEDSNGYIDDNRPKTDKFVEVTIDELAVKFNIPVETLKTLLKYEKP